MNKLFPKAWGINVTGRMRSTPADFQVDEIASVTPDGEGEHVWLNVKKTGANTDWVAGQLAKAAGLARKHVSYAGLKDRHAVTTQWFSLHLPGQATPEWSIDSDEFEILETHRHSRKLKRGTLTGNRFCITLRDCQGDLDSIDDVVKHIAAQGVPNYFGEQRFGHNMQNIDSARAWFSSGERPKQKQQASIYLSAARSWIFNHILAKRIADNTWNTALDGDVFMLNGTQSVFKATPDATLQQRLIDKDIHITGALWGEGELMTDLNIKALEQSIADEHTDLVAGLIANRLKQERRALRLVPESLTTSWLDKDVLQVTMTLPAGSYATAFLRELGDFN